MNLKRYFSMLTALLAVCMASAQAVTTSPAIIQTDTKNIVISYHADRGNKQLMNLPEGTEVYVHTGVITDASASDSEWKYAPTWGDNAAKYKMKRKSANLYTLTIPDINTYYGITDPKTVVRKLAFVFRTADNSKEGKGDGNSDIMVNVLAPGFRVTIQSDAAGKAIKKGEKATFTAYATKSATISLSITGQQAPFASKDNVTKLSADYQFDEPGDYTVTATAKSGDETVTESLQVAVTEPAEARDYPGGVPVQGAVRQADGSVIFCIAAPGKESAMVVGSWNDYAPSASGRMNYQDYKSQRYFWTKIEGLKEATDYFYYYLIDSSRKVGDPYARLILDPYNDRYIPSSVFPGLPPYPKDKVGADVPLAIYNSTRDDYDWKVKNFRGVDKSDLIIYELLIRDFTGTEGEAKGNGTVKGVIEKLDYLKELGINAVELLPIMEFNGNNSWGYNTNFYFAPDKAYGTPDDYRRLIDECHSRGIAVILDIVFNQSDGLHPWYQMYDIASNPFYNGSAPHAYSVLNDWNQDNSLVQQQWHDALAYWLTAYKVDGFRFDLVKGLGDNNSYNNTYDPVTNTFGSPSDANTNAYNATRIARMKALHDAMRKVNPDAYFINENLAGATEENEMAQDGELNWANINTEARNFATATSANSGLNRFYAVDDSRTWGTTVSYAESHDEERMAYAQSLSNLAPVKSNLQVSTRRLGSVAAQMLMSPGAHMIWQFQEFGADQTTKKDGGNNTDPKTVVWDYLKNEYRGGLKDSYAELCKIRADYAQMFRQGVKTTMMCAAANWASGRYISLVNGDDQLICVVNPVLSPNATGKVTVPLNKPAAEYTVLSKSYNTTPEISDGQVSLLGGAYVVLATKSLASADIIETAAPFTVSTLGGMITVEGEFTRAEAYAADGRRVAIGTPLPSGIYIVSVDGKSVKVAL